MSDLNFPKQQYHVDYLVIGAGATAMSFVDTLIDTHPTVKILMIDKRSRPGGHWCDAYPFVRLHQPALYYGVRSTKLENNQYDLVSKFQILGYYDRVLTRLQNTGRVDFLGQCVYQPYQNHAEDSVAIIHSLCIVNHSIAVSYQTLVDTTYMQITVPSVNRPKYEIDPQTHVVPINGLASLGQPYEYFVVIGAGKTGIDAILYLLTMGVDPQKITWIMSQDAWLYNRAHAHPKHFNKSLLKQLDVLKNATTLEDLMCDLEEIEFLLRLDEQQTPTAYRCATVSQAELNQLRTIQKIIRLGRVKRVCIDRLILDQGEVPIHPQSLVIDCTSDGLTRRPPQTIFDHNKITLQSVVMCQPTYGASVLGYIEGRFRDDLAKKNQLANPVPHPNIPVDFLSSLSSSLKNMTSWISCMPLWLGGNRLNVGHHVSMLSNLRLGWNLYRNLDHILANLALLEESYRETSTVREESNTSEMS
jgi:hypothetical protein